MHQLLTLTSLARTDLIEMAALLLAQGTRQQTLDVRLPVVHAYSEGERGFLQQDAPLLVVRDAQGHLRGCVQPGIWELSEQSALHAFLTSRNGIARRLILPSPSDEDASIVTVALLDALLTFWRCYETTGDLLRWPTRDSWLEPYLLERGFLLDSVCAIHSQRQPDLFRQSSSHQVRIRLARPEDEESLVELFYEELLAHQPYTPFVHPSPGVLHAFRAKLKRLWAGKTLAEGAPLVIIVEERGEIVAMAECTLLTVEPGDEPGFTPMGRYGCIDNIGVKPMARGQRIGSLLVQAVFDAFVVRCPDLSAYILWYNPDNPLAHKFWSRLGFEPLWTTYQRLHSVPK